MDSIFSVSGLSSKTGVLGAAKTPKTPKHRAKCSRKHFGQKKITSCFKYTFFICSLDIFGRVWPSVWKFTSLNFPPPAAAAGRSKNKKKAKIVKIAENSVWFLCLFEWAMLLNVSSSFIQREKSQWKWGHPVGFGDLHRMGKTGQKNNVPAKGNRFLQIWRISSMMEYLQNLSKFTLLFLLTTAVKKKNYMLQHAKFWF